MTVATSTTGPAPPRTPGWRLAVRRFRRHRGAWLGAVGVLVLVACAVLAPWIAPHPPTAADLAARLLPPGRGHWLGTDDLGRDVLSRLIAGTRDSLWVGGWSVAIATGPGVALGLMAGYGGRWLDEAIMRGLDVVLAFPSVLLAILIVAVLGPSLDNALIAIGVVNVPVYARLVRAQVLGVKHLEYVEAARSLGGGHLRLVLRHILPNVLTPVVVQATLGFATAILETAGLSFLGLGAQPPEPEWGAMLNAARPFIRSAPWTVTFPGLAIMAVVLAFNLLGDGLREALDPQQRT